MGVVAEPVIAMLDEEDRLATQEQLNRLDDGLKELASKLSSIGEDQLRQHGLDADTLSGLLQEMGSITKEAPDLRDGLEALSQSVQQGIERLSAEHTAIRQEVFATRQEVAELRTQQQELTLAVKALLKNGISQMPDDLQAPPISRLPSDISEFYIDIEEGLRQTSILIAAGELQTAKTRLAELRDLIERQEHDFTTAKSEPGSDRSGKDIAGPAFSNLLFTAFFQLGYIGFEECDYETSVQEYEKALHYARAMCNTERIAITLNQIGVAHATCGDHSRAEREFREALRLLPGDNLVLFNLGASLADQGKNEEAEKALRAYLQGNPKDAEGQHALGLVLYETNIVDEAEFQFSEAVELDPHHERAHHNLGVILAERADFDAAESHFEHAVTIKPNWAQAHYSLGTLFLETERIPEAIREFETALKIDTAHVQARGNLGTALARSGRLEEGLAEFRSLLETQPGEPLVHHNIGTALAILGRFAEAVKHHRQAVHAVPEDPEFHFGLGLALYNLRERDQDEEATGEFRQAVKMMAGDSRYRLYLARALARCGDMEEATEQYCIYVGMRPDDAWARQRYGTLLALRGDFDGAIRELEQALALDDTMATGWYNLGSAYGCKNMKEDVIRCWKRYLVLEPNGDHSVEVRAFIRQHAKPD